MWGGIGHRGSACAWIGREGCECGGIGHRGSVCVCGGGVGREGCECVGIGHRTSVWG